ncbi:MAG: ABC transporter substrate-binding protein [Bacteroidia bacterium]|nr:ABC transporter substrate-binding protein [Bacteroidia bacterium]
MPAFTDQLNRKIELSSTPKRIISLVPSQTELLYDLGLRDEVVGITKFCIHPDEWFRSKVRVGGTKKIDFEKIKELQPDLIIGNKEENDQGLIEELMKLYPVWISDIYTLKDAYDMITRVGTLVGKQQEATFLKLQIESQFNQFIQSNVPSNKKTAYFIWNDPYMVAGANTFINEVLKLNGLENIFADKDSRYPEVSAEELKKLQPELILLSSEPYPFKQKHMDELQLICPSAKILLVDGELFSWYGSRLLKIPEYLKDLNRLIGE